MYKIIIFFWAIFLIIFGEVNAQVIFQDDLEADSPSWKCTSLSNQLSRWDAGTGACESTEGFGPEWKMGPGRNGGNAVYSWKKSGVPNGYRSESRKWLYGDDIKTEIYHKWYMKVPPAYEYNKDISSGYKFWRYITRENGTPCPEIYLSALGSTFDKGNLVAFFYPGTSLILTPISNFNDGQWHCHELRIKLNSSGSASDGIIEYWLDGVKKASHTNINFGNVDNLAIHRIGVGVGNVSDGAWYQEEWSAIGFDDIVVSTEYIGPDSNHTAPNSEPEPEPIIDSEPALEDVIFIENFENTDIASNGWYDNTKPEFSTTETVPGSTRSLQMHFLQGDTKPVQGGAMRRQFQETDSLTVSYNVKYSNNWQGSGTPLPPHEVYVLTNKNSAWSGLAFTHLTTYIEHLDGRPKLGLQDGQNIDQSKIGTNLVGVTESRSVMGCNGDSDGHGSGGCYDAGSGTYYNGKQWIASNPVIVPGQWHKVEVFYKLNSIVDGKGIADGVMRYRLDGNLIINLEDLMFRTGQHPDMKFNQFVIAPYIGSGSPVEQSFWMDNLVLSAPLGWPTSLRIISN